MLRRTGLLAGAAQEVEGVIEISGGERHSWLVLDSAAGRAAVIDMRPEHASAVEELLARHRCSLHASLSTEDAASWEVQGDGMMIGRWRIRRVESGSGQVYLLDGETGKARYAFIGNISIDQLAGIVGPDMLLCRSSGKDRPSCTTLRARPSDKNLSASDMELGPGGLLALLDREPDAMIVDVREDFEHGAGRLPERLRTSINVPLARLVNAIPGWLATAHPRPIVFFCRSGNRSALATSRMRALGYDKSFHLHGGLARTEYLLDTVR